MTLLQPLLHDLVTCVCAPTTVLSDGDGQITPTGAQGTFHADQRVLSRAELTLDGRQPECVLAVLDGPSAARFTLLARWLGAGGADPSVRIERHRRATPDGLVEHVVVTSAAAVAVHSRLQIELEVDLASIDNVKAGRAGATPAGAETSTGTALWRGSDGLLIKAVAPGAELHGTPTGARLSWPLDLVPGGSAELHWGLTVADPSAVVSAPAAPRPWARPTVQADNGWLPLLVERSLDDLEALRLVLPKRPEDQFLGAGSPWFLTLFGRDSLWAARMLLPLGTDLAAGTLSALASMQGKRDDPMTEEAPGKIMHELRRGAFDLPAEPGGRAGRLPPVYFGTVDATPLWMTLLHDAWRWGMAPDRVESLLPHLEAAAGWLIGPADADGDGFLEYIDSTGRGLANQGWKDSGDSVLFHDGRQAKPPIALAEVQGYAYEAAGCAATLLTTFGRPGADRLLHWRADLADRFRKAFWVEGPDGGYPAMALDGAKQPVDAVTSNPGHLLGTGLLNPQEAALVAARIGSAELDSGYGLRTMSTHDAGYSALSYHRGSVWPHDTAIVVSGLLREGLTDQAASLIAGLIKAGGSFAGRMPELWAGDSAEQSPQPVPYPAACRPQAWAAAAAVSVLRDLIGLSVDVPAGVLRLAPLSSGPAGAVSVRGLAAGDGLLDVDVDRDGVVRLADTTGSLRTEIAPEGVRPRRG